MKIRGTVLFALFTMACFFIFLQTAQADNHPTVLVDEKTLLFDESPIISQGTTLVQMKPIFDNLGIDLTWNSTTKSIVAKKGELLIKMQVGNEYAQVNNEEIKLPVVPTLIKGYTFVPVRFISEATGAKIVWDVLQKQINIFSTNESLVSYYIKSHDVEKAAQIIQTQINVNYVDREGTSLLEKAINEGEKDLSIMLIQKGAIVNTTNREGVPLLFSAIRLGQVDLVKAFIDRGIEINEKQADGYSALSYSQYLLAENPKNQNLDAVNQYLENESKVLNIHDSKQSVKALSNNLAVSVNKFINGEKGFLLNVDVENLSDQPLYLKQWIEQAEIIVNDEQLRVTQFIPFRYRTVDGYYYFGIPSQSANRVSNNIKDGFGWMKPKYKANFDLIFEPMKGQAEAVKLSFKLTSQVGAAIDNNEFVFRIRPGNKVNTLLTKEEMETYMNNKYTTLDTVLGSVQIKCFADVAIYSRNAHDYIISVGYDDQFVKSAMNNELTTELRERLKQQLIEFQEKLAKDLTALVSVKKVKGYFDSRIWTKWYSVNDKGVIYYKYFVWTNYDYPVSQYNELIDFDLVYSPFQKSIYALSSPSNFRWVDMNEGTEYLDF